MLTCDIMREMWPHGDAKIPGLVDGIAAAASSVFLKYGLTSDLLVAHAMAQFSHECGAGNEVVENLNYSAQGFINTWPKRFDAAKGAQFAHDQQRIANEAYNGRMGNRLGTEDGWNYRGRGGSQVTGRNGYIELGEKVGLPLIDQPDLVNNPQHFLECAVADFIICGCLPFAAHDDVNGVTYHLNGGYIGLQERTEWLARWRLTHSGARNRLGAAIAEQTRRRAAAHRRRVVRLCDCGGRESISTDKGARRRWPGWSADRSGD